MKNIITAIKQKTHYSFETSLLTSLIKETNSCSGIQLNCDTVCFHNSEEHGSSPLYTWINHINLTLNTAYPFENCNNDLIDSLECLNNSPSVELIERINCIKLTLYISNNLRVRTCDQINPKSLWQRSDSNRIFKRSIKTSNSNDSTTLSFTRVTRTFSDVLCCLIINTHSFIYPSIPTSIKRTFFKAGKANFTRMTAYSEAVTNWSALSVKMD